MEGLYELIVIVLGVALFFTILYFVVKLAVRNGIIEAKNMSGENSEIKSSVTQKTCPNCSKSHDFDYPKCPYCKFRYVDELV